MRRMRQCLAVLMAVFMAMPGLPASAAGAQVQENPTEIVAEAGDEQIEAYAEDIASGTSGGITWRIDGDGKLFVSGSGDWDSIYAPWSDYGEQIVSAEVNVTGMTTASSMFLNCSNLSSVDLSRLDTSSVTIMGHMFSGCNSLSSVDLSGLNTSNVTSMWCMFSDCSGLSSVNLSGLDTSSVTNMESMFSNCSSLSSLDMGGLDTSSVLNMNSMFSGCSSLSSLDVSGFNTSSVTSMKFMFSGCSSLSSLDVSNFNTGSVTNMSGMFSGCSNLSSVDVRGIDTSSVTDMSGMFELCSGLKSLDLSGFDVGSVEQFYTGPPAASTYWGMVGMFSGCENLLTIRSPYNNTGTTELPDVASGTWKLSDGTQITELPLGLSESVLITRNLEISGISGGITWGIDRHGKLFVSGTGDWDSEVTYNPWYDYCRNITSAEVNVTGMTSTANMFRDCTYLSSVDLSGLDTSSVTDMAGMFYGCTRLSSLDVSGLDTSSVTNMSNMFIKCRELRSLDLSGFNTGNVTDMSDMFEGCSELRSVDVSGFNTSNVTNMYQMFMHCGVLSELDLSSFHTSSVTNMGQMFHGCSSLSSVNVSSFDTSNVTSIGDMFTMCSSLSSLDLSSFDLRNVSSIEPGIGSMISSCSNLTSINAPCNVNAAINFPFVINTEWYREDNGEVVTELPRNLSESVLILRRDTAPTITTTTTDLNMEDVIRVKYVPYFYTVRTSNTDEDNVVTFSVVEGRLAKGLEMYPDTGEIYGVPLEAGEFKVTVKASYSNSDYEPAYAELTLIVLENTDANVSKASDAGYEIIEPVPDLDLGSLSGDGSHTVVSKGEYDHFCYVFLDGRRLEKDEYTSEEGSTRVTIVNQTFVEAGAGNHTLGLEFYNRETGERKRAAQNITVSKVGENGGNTSNNGNGSTDNNGDTGNAGGTGSGGNSGDNSSDDSGDAGDSASLVSAVSNANSSTTVIYTVAPGDTLWKIAVKFYGAGGMWRRIYEENAGVIRDPGKLYVGQKLVIRLSGAAGTTTMTAAAASGEASSYQVQSGDSLWKIAQRFYGKGGLWERIYQANQNAIASPDRLRVGQKLVVPGR
ncbi:MAG: BspA family leucine-rich repeat surface protein [Candidatus Gastranaerophilales bacterium]|nr:BspA family leucine-rich repeat surface protein [Candidatus Gastranaerophilales bacterium]